MTIRLERVEQQLFTLLLDCVHQRRLPVTLRVAGGWVRDKLLGLSSHDIDIAIDQMMGRSFVEHLCEYMRTATNTIDYASNDNNSSNNNMLHGVGVIKSNPERSKHLETATMIICGMSVDFVNLRSEAYANDTTMATTTTPMSPAMSVSSSSSSSRIPYKVDFGTPLQDAMRRDITINALFYNLHTGQVEDYCGSGLADLHAGLIRTPMDPMVTLLDDPLRLLRVIRFAARFGYRIVPDLQLALRDHNVHRAFRVKVSRERVGIEVDKMLSGRDEGVVMTGMRYLLDEHIYKLLFVDNVTVNTKLLRELYESVTRLYDHVRLAAYCTLMLPLASVDSVDPSSTCKDTLVIKALRDGLKLPSRDYQLIGKLVDGVSFVINCDLDSPISVGRVIMALGEHYRLSCLLADCHDRLFNGHMSDVKYRDGFTAAAERYNLSNCYEMKPILTGDDIKTFFNLNNKDGKRVGQLLRRSVDLQLCYPSITRDQLIEIMHSHES